MPATIIQKYYESAQFYGDSLDISYKKKNGIFYTDLTLASLIISELEINPESIVLDPCCGVGSFLVAAAQKGAHLLYGIDIDPNAINECTDFLENATIVEADSIYQPAESTLLRLGLTGKVDFIIGNPPYAQLNNSPVINLDDVYFMENNINFNKNLFVAALLRSLELVKSSGIIAYIIPKNFLHVDSYRSARQILLMNKTILSIIDIGAYFKDVRGEQIVIIIKNESSYDNYISFKELNSYKFNQTVFIKQDFFKDEILLFKSDREFDIYKKMISSYKTIGNMCHGYVGRGRSRKDNAITGKEIRKFGFKNTPTPQIGNKIFIQNIYSSESGIIAAFGGDLEATQTVTVFTDGDEKMCRYILAFLHSRLCNYFLYRFCYNSSHLTMHTDAKYLKKIPFTIKDKKSFEQILATVSEIEMIEYMSIEWYDLMEVLNEQIYDIFNFSKEESDFIDNEMMRVHSKRWQPNEHRQAM